MSRKKQISESVCKIIKDIAIDLEILNEEISEDFIINNFLLTSI